MKKIISKINNKDVVLLEDIPCRAVIGYLTKKSVLRANDALMLGYPLNSAKGYAFFNTNELTGGIVVNADNPQDAIHAMKTQLNMEPEEFFVFDSMKEAIIFANRINSKQQ